MKRVTYLLKVIVYTFSFILFFVLPVLDTETFALAMIMSPKPPPPALPTSLPPQQAPLPVAPWKLTLQQGYFRGEEGVQLFYRIVGSGKDTIVFVHGSGGLGIEDGALEIELLAKKGYTLIEYDQRGVARSELVCDSAKLTMNDQVMDLHRRRGPSCVFFVTTL